MPRPRDPDRPRWEWPDILGYMAPLERGDNRRTYALHYYKGYRKSSGLLFEPRYRSVARKLHEQWIHEILLRDRGLVVDPDQLRDRSAPDSLLTASDVYLEAQRRTMAENTQVKFRQAIAGHFPHDLPLAHDRIYEALILSINSGHYADSTLRKHLAELGRFFRYCIHRRWLDRNPVELIQSPMEPQRHVEIWTEEELERIKNWLRTDSKAFQAEWVALAIDWTRRTAMRPSEMLRMQWRHVTAEELTIPKTKTARPRALPLATSATLRKKHPKRAAWQAELRSMIDELRRLYDEERPTQLAAGRGAPDWPEGFVWPWREPKTIQQEFRLARQALGLEDGRRFYDLRATAEDYWVWELGFGIDQVCAYGGHSPAVFVKHYKRRYGAEDRRRLLET